MKINGTQKAEIEISEQQEKYLLVDLLKKRMGLKDGGHVRTDTNEVIIEMIDVGYHKAEMEVQSRRPATELDLAAHQIIVAMQEGKF